MAYTMPPFWNVDRVLTLARLAIGGFTQAVGAIIAGWCAVKLMTTGFNWLMINGLIICATLSVLLTIVLRRKAERFALDRVHELRMATVALALRMVEGKSAMGHGVLMARVVNDFSAIKLWLSDGLVSIVLASGVLTGCFLGLWALLPEYLTHFLMALGIASAPIVVLAFRLRQVIAKARRERGRLANHISRISRNRHWWIGVGRYTPLMRRTERISHSLQSQLVDRATLAAVGKACAELFPYVFAVLAVMLASVQTDATNVAIALYVLGLAGTQFSLLARSVELALANAVALGKLKSVFDSQALPAPKDGATYTPNKTMPVLSIVLPATKRNDKATLAFQEGTASMLTAQDREATTQLTAILSGFAVAPEGRVFLHGNDLSKIRLRDVYRRISALTDKPMHLRGTLLSAICKGIPSSADRNACIKAAHQVGLSDEELFLRFSEASPLPWRLAVLARFANALVRKAELIVVAHDGVLADQVLIHRLVQLTSETRATLLLVTSDRAAERAFSEVCPLSQIAKADGLIAEIPAE